MSKLKANHWECAIGDSVDPLCFWPPTLPGDENKPRVIEAYRIDMVTIQDEGSLEMINERIIWIGKFGRSSLGEPWYRIS